MAFKDRVYFFNILKPVALIELFQIQVYVKNFYLIKGNKKIVIKLTLKDTSVDW